MIPYCFRAGPNSLAATAVIDDVGATSVPADARLMPFLH